MKESIKKHIENVLVSSVNCGFTSETFNGINEEIFFVTFSSVIPSFILRDLLDCQVLKDNHIEFYVSSSSDGLPRLCFYSDEI